MEVNGDKRILLNEELHNTYSTFTIFRSRRIKSVGHLACMVGDGRQMNLEFWLERLKSRDNFRELSIDWRAMLYLSTYHGVGGCGS